MNTELSRFASYLRELVRSGFYGENFGALALNLFALQFKGNLAYRTICKARGLKPETVGHWTQIPAVPTAAFKELELTSLAPGESTAVFHSSGTTAQIPSRHFHSAESLAVYEASLWKWFDQNLLSNFEFRTPNLELLVLTPTPEQAPHSSLVHMFEIVRQKFGLPESVFMGKLAADDSWTLNFAATIQALKAAHATGKTLTLLGTAFSFVHLLDYLAEKDLRLQLPAGSRVMETGGYKNRSRTLSKADLHALTTERLGVPRENIVCEYGMSELSSQAYAVAGGSFQFPPWARVQIISPETGREVGDGETGLIRVFDLANVFSVAAIQTEDLAIRRGDGFELIGRAEQAEPRGCSLMTA
jgi:hypothetical protein